MVAMLDDTIYRLFIIFATAEYLRLQRLIKNNLYYQCEYGVIFRARNHVHEATLSTK